MSQKYFVFILARRDFERILLHLNSYCRNNLQNNPCGYTIVQWLSQTSNKRFIDSLSNDQVLLLPLYPGKLGALLNAYVSHKDEAFTTLVLSLHFMYCRSFILQFRYLCIVQSICTQSTIQSVLLLIIFHIQRKLNHLIQLQEF